MKELRYQLSFATPAFLGNAEQQGQWRTPPFKALIRQWWRVVQRARAPSDIERMRFDEGMLFGNAWLSNERGEALHRKSSLLIRLSEHGEGTLKSDKWPRDFDLVPTSATARLGADVYTGYGPVTSEKAIGSGRRIVIRNAIDAGKSAQLRLGMVDPIPGLDDTLALLHWFGSAGSRARNGWGSVHLEPDNDEARSAALGDALELARRHSRPWRECFALDWPHAIGSDDRGPLVWQTEELPHWRAAIGRLARVRVAARLIAKRMRDDRSKAGAIHYLGYPAGTGPKNPWALPLRNGHKGELRFASPLRFKIVRSGKGVRALVFHMPCRLPGAFTDNVDETAAAWLNRAPNWERAWSSIHQLLDEDQDPMSPGRPLGLKRLGASA
jgi:CRISPR-associated protein Cmr1